MSAIRNFDLRGREEVLAGLTAFLARLGAAYPFHEAYAFGSFVRDEMHEGSDIDLILVADVPGKMHERIAEVLRFAGDLPVEPLVYPPALFERMRRENDFVRRALAGALRLEGAGSPRMANAYRTSGRPIER